MVDKKKMDKTIGLALKAAIVLYLIVLAVMRSFRTDIYKIFSIAIEALIGLTLVYFGAKWALKKLGYLKNGAITGPRKALANTLGALTLGIIFAIFIEVVAHHLYLTQQATLNLNVSKAGREALGDPIRVGWYIHGYQRSDVANFSIPVKGSKASGKLELKGIREGGSWHIVDLDLIIDGNAAAVQIPH